MAKELIKSALKALLPDGALWTPAEDEDFDKFLDGVSENWETARQFLYDIGYTRNPFRTPLLEELEREFGILANFDLTEDLRRQQLAALKYDQTENYASAQNLQDFLNNAGFDVVVNDHCPQRDVPTHRMPPHSYPVRIGVRIVLQGGHGVEHVDSIVGRAVATAGLAFRESVSTVV